MEHFITEIKIDGLRHLSNITISLNQEQRQHLILTGKNGSGKTTLLLALQSNLSALNDGNLSHFLSLEKEIKDAKTPEEKEMAQFNYNNGIYLIEHYKSNITIQLLNFKDIDDIFKHGNFITAFFPANRYTDIAPSHGVTDIKLKTYYAIHEKPGTLLQQYMVHLKTQQSYARNEGDIENADRIQQWFNRFMDALRILLDDDSITLEYDYKNYNFLIHETGKLPFGFNELSDGYSSVIHIVSDLILRMDKNWLLGDKLSQYDVEGIVLIDELETHLHIELQKKILPFLTAFFPRIQFIVTTHSPYILNSVSNAKAYDLERCVELENLSSYSSDGLAEGYFGADEYADELKEKMIRYQFLKEKTDPSEEERAERAKLRLELKYIPKELAIDTSHIFANEADL
ncbi:MAG: ATP-binding protein [Lachnospiraceae bacterium]|nr:ATP-binding protein [Lachnospiraceae bacterium]